LNCASVSGDVTGELEDAFIVTGAALQNTILDGAVSGGSAVLLVTFPVSNVGDSINVGPETFNWTVGVADGTNDDEFTGAIIDGGNVAGTTGGLVGTLDPMIALQLGASKLAQMGVNDA
jgi:hypothetical protein